MNPLTYSLVFCLLVAAGYLLTNLLLKLKTGRLITVKVISKDGTERVMTLYDHDGKTTELIELIKTDKHEVSSN